jgi:hypothetical protein
MVGWTGSARTTSVEIPLSELSGSYNSATRQTTFRFDRVPVEIYGASLKLQGWTDPGSWYCDCGTLPVLAWRTEFTATMSDSTTGGVWRADSLVGDGPFDDRPPFDFEVVIPFMSTNGASWTFLEAGRGTLFLGGVPAHVTSCGVCFGVAPKAKVYLVTLIVDADYQIGTNSSTWGSIKALFAR